MRKLLVFAGAFLDAVLICQASWPDQNWWGQGPSIWPEKAQLDLSTLPEGNFILNLVYDLLTEARENHKDFVFKDIDNPNVRVSFIVDEDTDEEVGFSGFFDPTINSIIIKLPKRYLFERIELDLAEILAHEIQHAIRHKNLDNVNFEIYAITMNFLSNMNSGMGREEAFNQALEETNPKIKDLVFKWYKDAFMTLPIEEIIEMYKKHHEAEPAEQEAHLGTLFLVLESNNNIWELQDRESMKRYIINVWLHIIGTEMPEYLADKVTDVFWKAKQE